MAGVGLIAAYKGKNAMNKRQVRIFVVSTLASFLVIYAVATIRSSSDEIDDLEGRVTDLTDELHELQAKADELASTVDDLESRLGE